MMIGSVTSTTSCNTMRLSEAKHYYDIAGHDYIFSWAHTGHFIGRLIHHSLSV
jgi:hypothetical protein